jgi:tRNA A-37 threonylcarbamoyl transferase component Bud32
VIRRVDRYELLEQVGSGGMAVVYRGRDSALDREVAVKLLHPHLASRAESRARFSREARAVARLSHPNIVEIYDYAGDAANESYLVTEFVRGRTLRAFAEEEGVGYPEVGALMARALADALVHAHAAGVIHRDLKPENVLVLEVGGRRALKLVDFGIARILASDEKMTLTGALVGSPNHMAPEIIEGREADEKSDLFSLGTILYWLAVGRMPFAAPNPTATLRRVIDGDYQEPREVAPLVSDPLADVIARALEPDPASRTASASALRDDLDRALAAAGLDDAEGELVAFLDDPKGYKAALPARLVAFALGRADQALSAGETARAMRHMNRVLAIDPENAAVAARLARMERRARRARVARRAAAAALAVAAMAGAGWSAHAWHLRRTALRLEESARRAAETAAVAARAATAARASASEAPSPQPAAAPAVSSRPSDPLPAPRPSRELEPATTLPAARRPAVAVPASAMPASEVVALVRPYAQRALLDGVEIARGEQRVSFALAPGRPHRLQIEHACCFPFVRDFGAAEPLPQSLELKVPLAPRPARLRVDAELGTRVFVDGRATGTAEASQRAPIEISIPATGDTPYEARVELRLERDGALPVRTGLRLRAGADVTFAAPPAQPAPATEPVGEPEAVAAPSAEGRGISAP